MPHADCLITGPEKVILPARENIVQKKFLRKLKLIMPCCDDKEHSPSEFYCHGETNDLNATFQGENNAEQNNSLENVANICFHNTLMASFCMERLLFVKKFTLYFRRLNFFLWSIVIVLLLQQVHCQKPPVYTAESCSNESVFCFFLQSQNKLRSNKAI